jgi:hypothetical protein
VWGVCGVRLLLTFDIPQTALPDRKSGINLIPSRYHWDQLDAKVIVLDINFPVRLLRLWTPTILFWLFIV